MVKKVLQAILVLGWIPTLLLLAEDTTGHGHISRALGTKDRISLFIPLADGATPPR